MPLIIDKNYQDHIDVIVNPGVMDIWEKYRQTSRWDKEACGVLIGGYEAKNNRIIVDDCTKPMKGDIRRKHSFLLQDMGHQVAVNSAYRISNGTSFYLGTWHTHPTKRPSPSYRDLNDWKSCIARNPLIPSFIFAIIGTESVFLDSRIINI